MPEVPNFKNYVADVVREEKAAKPDYTDPLLEVDLANLVPLPDLSDSPDGVWNGEYLSRSHPSQNFAVPIAIDLDPTKFYTLLIDVEFDSTEARPDGAQIYILTMGSDNTLDDWYTLYEGEKFVGRRTVQAVVGPGDEGWDYSAADGSPETRMVFEFDSLADPKIYSVTLFEGDRSASIEIGDAVIRVSDDGKSLRMPPLVVDGERLPKMTLNPYGYGVSFTNHTPLVNPFTASQGFFDPGVYGAGLYFSGDNIVPDAQQPIATRIMTPGLYRISGALRFTGDVTDRALMVNVNLMEDSAFRIARGKKIESPDQTEFAFSELVMVTSPNTWMSTWLRWLSPGPVTVLAPVKIDSSIVLKLELS